MQITNKKYLIIFFILSISLYGLASINQKNVETKVLNVVERDNQYVIQNSIISPNNLENIISNTDVKMVFLQSNQIPTRFIEKTRIIPFNDIITTIKGIPYITTQEKVAVTLSNAGIKDDDIIVIYDVGNSPYLTRLFWTLKVYGHEYVKILNGGLNNWIKHGYKTVKYPVKPEKTVYLAHEKNIEMIANMTNIAEAMKNENEVILDVRSSSEYNRGHIPGAVNIPYQSSLYNNGLFKNFEDLQKVYHPKGVTPTKEMIYVYCSTGNPTTMTYFVLHELMGYNNVKVYDGSYAEFVKYYKYTT